MDLYKYNILPMLKIEIRGATSAFFGFTSAHASITEFASAIRFFRW